MFPWLIPFCGAVANAILAVIVLRHGPHKPLNRLFCLVTATIVSWNLNLFSLYFFAGPEEAFYWSTVFRTGTLLMPPAVAHLFLFFGGRWHKLSRIYITFAYVLATILIFANALNLLTYGVRPHVWGYYPVVAPAYALHVVSVVINFAVAAVAMVLNVLDAADAQKRLQATFWLIGAGIGMIGGLTNLLPLYHIGFYPIGNLANVPYTAIIAYAVIRHRLMDIDIVVTKSLSYLTSAVVLVMPSVLLVTGMQRWAFGTVNYDFSIAVAILIVGTGALFPVFRLRTQTQIEQSFFREKRDYRRTLRGFAKVIIRILDRDRLVREIGRGLAEIIGLDQMAVYVREASGTLFRAAYVRGELPVREAFEKEDPIISYLENRGESVLREEVEAYALEGVRAVAQAFTESSWEVCVPLVISGELVGFLGLGPKRNREAFTAVDLDLLDTLAVQAGTAFENARLSEELHRSRDIIQRAGRMSALGTLAAGIAHEIRNPLVSIQTFFQLAPERLHDEEFVTSFLGLAENEVKRISDLVSELLTFARSHRDAVQEVDLDEAIDGTLRLLMPQSLRQQVKLVRAGGDVLPTVRADPDRIKQVLVNIVLNAIQATSAGGLVSVAARVIERGRERFCQVEVRDTGAGIPVAAQEDIFNPFFTTKDKGTGLGLSIAHQIVTEHGGFITVESREKEGSCFAIHLPVVGEKEKEGVAVRG
jgi:two-component system NtrC family sensor kinase